MKSRIKAGKSRRKLKYKILDTLKNMSTIEYNPDNENDEDLSDVSLFQEVEDSAAYIRELRQNACRK